MSNRFKSLSIGIAAGLLVACGGGGVSTPPNTTEPTPTPTPDVQLPSPGVFSIEQNHYATTLYEYEHSLVVWEVNGMVDRADEGLIVFADLSESQLIESADVVLDEETLSGTLSLTSVESSLLLPGTYYETITVNACTTLDCHRHYTGSPAQVEIAVSVLPNENIDASCAAAFGVVFEECVPAPWLGVAAWEMTADGTFVQLKHMDGDNPDRLVNWQVLESGDPERGNVLEVTYNALNANGSLRFPAAYNELRGEPTINMSEFATGTLEFDIKVLDWGAASDLKVHIECFWPCTSQNIDIPISSLNEWQHVSLSLDALEELGLNLITVSTGFLIEPTWDAMQGLRYQLDNVRWLPGEPLPLGTLYAGAMTPEIAGAQESEITFDSYFAYVTPNWDTIEDRISLIYTLDSHVDFSSRIGMNLGVSIPESFQDSQVQAQLFVRDSLGRESRGFPVSLGEFAGLNLELTFRDLTSDIDENFDVSSVAILGVRLIPGSNDVGSQVGTLQFNSISFRRY